MTETNLLEKAEMYLKLCYRELDKEHLYENRWLEVKKDIKQKGTYNLLEFELNYGTKVAWRNSNKCIGRLFWKAMDVFDRRSLSSTDAIFESLFEHINLATNGGNIKSTISVYDPNKEILIWNPQLLSFAGYENPDGSITGDSKQVSFTKECIKLGWKPKNGEFDILPLIIQIDNQIPVCREIPPNIITIVKIEHPEIESFKDLNLQWYSTPIISNMILEVGGIEFKAAPFNGWYMGTEIGARNFADEKRYNMLPKVAKLMGLNLRDKINLWKDRAIVELNHAVLYSFKNAGVKIVDHHTASKQFMQFMKKEAKENREATAEWSWIVPPISGSTTEVFHTEMNNVIRTPNYFYRIEPWE
jgi:nitric-oxide synthase